MLLIKNGRVVDPKSGLDTQADVLVDGKKVVKIAENIELEMLKSSMRLVLWLLLVWWISMFISVSQVKPTKKTFILALGSGCRWFYNSCHDG